LISNEDCIKLRKKEVKNKSIKHFIFDNINLNKLGKILIDNDEILTIQKGRPYFFPNCQDTDSINSNDLKYKLIDLDLSYSNLFNKKYININYCNITNKPSHLIPLKNYYEKLDFPKILIKKRGKYYSSGIPILVREFLVSKKDNKSSKLANLEKIPWNGYLDYKDKTYKTKRRDLLTYLDRVRLENVFLMFVKSSEIITNKVKTNNTSDSKTELATLGLLEHPFRNIGIHSITEDYFEKDVNSVFCKNGEFIESGQTIGFLNFEKEISELENFHDQYIKSKDIFIKDYVRDDQNEIIDFESYNNVSKTSSRSYFPNGKLKEIIKYGKSDEIEIKFHDNGCYKTVDLQKIDVKHKVT